MINEKARELQNTYFHADVASREAGQGKLRKGKFMMDAFPNVYKNEASGRRQFNKLMTGETSGERIYARLGLPKFVRLRHRRPTKIIPGRLGLWHIIVTFRYYGKENEIITEKRSFTAQSGDYYRMEDMPELHIKLQKAIEDHIMWWTSHDSVPGNYIDYYVEIYPIVSSNLPDPQMFPGREGMTFGTTGQRRINIDSLEI